MAASSAAPRPSPSRPQPKCLSRPSVIALAPDVAVASENSPLDRGMSDKWGASGTRQPQRRTLSFLLQRQEAGVAAGGGGVDLGGARGSEDEKGARAAA